MSDAILRELADRAEITELTAHAALWLDERRFDRTLEVFTDDVTARTPGGEIAGPDALTDIASGQHAHYAQTLHVPAAVIIGLDGDTAEVRAAANVALKPDDGTVVFVAARYRYRARRTPDGWRFSHLDVTPVFRTEPVEDVL